MLIPDAWEHHEPWPGGRFNHYYFDLNRDWAWQTQQESRAADGAVQPVAAPGARRFSRDGRRIIPITSRPPPSLSTPTSRPGSASFRTPSANTTAKCFDKNNWLYFTRETYDLFYPSYGDTWPTFNGAIGMTYEQGGGRPGRRADYAKSDGDTLTLSQRIAHHHAASLATIQATAERHDDLGARVREPTITNARTKPGGEYKTYVLAAANDPGQLQNLTPVPRPPADPLWLCAAQAQQNQRLQLHHRQKRRAYKSSRRDMVVSMYQPKSTLVKVLFEPRPALEDSLTYDITAWALPYAFGLQAYALKEQLKITEATPPAPMVRTSAAATTGTPYAYVARWN